MAKLLVFSLVFLFSGCARFMRWRETNFNYHAICASVCPTGWIYFYDGKAMCICTDPIPHGDTYWKPTSPDSPKRID